MSLINEALKKAQSERPSSARNHPAMQGMSLDPQPKPPKKKRYLFSFILAVLVVALLSTLVSTFLVYQIVGDDDSARLESSQPQQLAMTTPAEPPIQEPEVKQEIAAAPETAVLPGETAPSVATSQEMEPESAAQPLMEAQPEPVAAVPEPVVAAPQTLPVVEEPVAKLASYENNPLIWNRLQDLEIRGIMSGGTKVLILDTKTNKTRAYQPGDLVDGALSLKVSSINDKTINFENNDGYIFPKSF